MRKLRTDFGRQETPSAPYVHYHVEKLRETGIIRSEKPKTARTPENIAAVAECMREVPSTSIHRLPQQFKSSATSLRRI